MAPVVRRLDGGKLVDVFDVDADDDDRHDGERCQRQTPPAAGQVVKKSGNVVANAFLNFIINKEVNHSNQL